jgi:hypothetical protein
MHFVKEHILSDWMDRLFLATNLKYEISFNLIAGLFHKTTQHSTTIPLTLTRLPLIPHEATGMNYTIVCWNWSSDGPDMNSPVNIWWNCSVVVQRIQIMTRVLNTVVRQQHLHHLNPAHAEFLRKQCLGLFAHRHGRHKSYNFKTCLSVRMIRFRNCWMDFDKIWYWMPAQKLFK